jgi:hypothetical protein
MSAKRSLPISGSSSWPMKYRKYMLKARCSGPECRKPAVMIRH